VAFDFASLFTPQRMQASQQGVQAINNMPWVFNSYGAPQQTAVTQTAAPAATQSQATTPLQNIYSLFGFTPEQQTQWTDFANSLPSQTRTLWDSFLQTDEAKQNIANAQKNGLL
jgi:hypothetical protein